jgi:mono/diheme cytochrome c family protein
VSRLRVFVLGALILLEAVGVWARVGTLVQQAPPKAQTLRNPFEGQQRATRAGAKLFARECAACHGSDGSGMGKAPPLNRFDVRDAPPGTLFWVLRNGSLKRGMPSFAHLPEAQRWQIITYVKLLKRDDR